jgi:hypothetical protein
LGFPVRCGLRVFLVGGYANHGTYAGPFFWYADYSAAGTTANIGRQVCFNVVPRKALPLGKKVNDHKSVLVGYPNAQEVRSSMKRYGDLYKHICTMDNIILAHERARRGKKFYTEVKMVDSAPDYYLGQIRKMLVNKTFVNSEYTVLHKREGKKDREIWKLPYYPDRIVHHAIVNILEPIWMRTYIRDTYAALPGRGIHDGVRRVKKALEDKESTQYCLKMDVRKFYQSIENEVLKQVVRKKVKCKDTLWLLDTIIESAPVVPIGNYTSQHFGNLVLSDLDHWIKEELRIKHYFRYCDDLVLLHHSKEEIHAIRQRVADYLRSELLLDMKGNWQVFPVGVRGIDFLGYRFFHGYTLVRKSIVAAFKRRYRNGNIRSLAAYNGWFKWADTHNLQHKYNWRQKYERLQHATA